VTASGVGAAPQVGRTVLFKAARNGQDEVVQALLDAGVVDAPNKVRGRSGEKLRVESEL